MSRPSKPTEKLRTIPRAQTLRQGSYRLATGSIQAVTIKPAGLFKKKPVEFNETDWMLATLDAVGEKAEAAYYEGLEQGMQYGLERGRSETQHAAHHFRRSLEALETQLLEFFSRVESWSVKLSLAIAEKVIGQAAEAHQELVRNTVQRALQETADKTRLLVRVHPADYEVLKVIRTDITALSEGIEHFHIEADESVTPGSCRIETPSGLLDADFGTQMQELRRALLVNEEVTA